MNKYINKIEKTLLASIIISNNKKLIKKIKTRYFQDKKNYIIFNVIKHMYINNKKIDLITLYYNLRKKNSFIKFSYINSIIDYKFNYKNLFKYIKILKKKTNIQQLYKTLKKYCLFLKFNKNINLNKIIYKIITKIKKIKKLKCINNKLSIKNKLNQIKQKIFLKKNFLKVLKTGYKTIDKLILGFSPGELIIIAGRPSTGKTAFCINLSQKICIKNKKPILFYSLEMSREQIIIRLISLLTKLNSRTEFTKTCNKKKLNYAFEKIKKSFFYINDTNSFNMYKFKTNIKKICKQKKIKIVFIDYLQLIYTGKPESRHIELSKISRDLKKISMDIKIPIVVVSQLNRNSELRVDKRPILSDLKDSGSIEQDADIIIFLYNKNFYNKKYSKTEFVIAKNRNGPIGFTKLKFIKNYTKFVNDD